MRNEYLDKWEKCVPNLKKVLAQMQEKTIIATGTNAYHGIIISSFLKNFISFAVNNSVDVNVLRHYMDVSCLEEKYPKVAQKIQSTSYLLGNFVFQKFLSSLTEPFAILLYRTTPPIIKKLKDQKINWMGNYYESFEDVFLKTNFRNLLKTLNLPSLPTWHLPKKEFLQKSFKEIFEKWGTGFVVQKGDIDDSGTFFMRTEKDWQASYEIISKNDRFHEIQISPLIVGPSLSMLGCITHKGVLTSTLQTQLIDVPESLCGQMPEGLFLGHDWGYCPWTKKTEQLAQQIVESIGKHIASKGFKGIFGVDFIYDQQKDELFPIECNPRVTGASPVYSLMTLELGKIPPIEFFHLMSLLDIKEDFDFETVNNGLKERMPLAHIAITSMGVYEMKVSLETGVYSYVPERNVIRFERPGALLSDIKNEPEFMIIDAVPWPEAKINQNVPRLCKIIFKRSIATSSSSIEPVAGEIISGLSALLRENQNALEEVEQQENSFETF